MVKHFCFYNSTIVIHYSANCFCPSNFTQFVVGTVKYGECVLVNNAPTTWIKARDYCTSIANTSAYLANIFNKNKSDFLKSNVYLIRTCNYVIYQLNRALIWDVWRVRSPPVSYTRLTFGPGCIYKMDNIFGIAAVAGVLVFMFIYKIYLLFYSCH
jgi:hypothetical protein